MTTVRKVHENFLPYSLNTLKYVLHEEIKKIIDLIVYVSIIGEFLSFRLMTTRILHLLPCIYS